MDVLVSPSFVSPRNPDPKMASLLHWEPPSPIGREVHGNEISSLVLPLESSMRRAFGARAGQ